MRRRTFLRASAAAVAALATTGAALRAARAPAKGGLRISCSSLAFSDMGWEEALELMRKQGFRCAELAMFEGWTHVDPSRLDDPEAHGKKIAEASKRIGIEAVCIHANFAPGVDRGSFPGITTPDEKLRDAVVEHCARVIRCARAAGIPLVNVQPGRFVAGEPRERSIERATRVLRKMMASAREHEVRLSFENHTGSLGERPGDVLALLEGVEGLELDYDLSHVVANSITVEQSRPLLPRVGHVAIRNARPGDYGLPVEGGELAFDLGPYLAALRDAGVEGHIAVEYFKPEQRPDNLRLKAILEKLGVAL